MLKIELSLHAFRCLIDLFYRRILRIVFSSKEDVLYYHGYTEKHLGLKMNYIFKLISKIELRIELHSLEQNGRSQEGL